ncbi:MAG TPA: hypothetical protein DCZ01_10980 [Elusimicrobia bacterium]|nr:MAG: hypothetical protein A2X37_01970 [Elusimicrobia bacterium GWA2_66_18]OGR77426.1 MAG: hypothetical protein A2X40_11245 [Elusimicrobia bacterium GWC2_65_9]HAZ09014.1 hypothetical protein [Elusimicrobiota bacterium]
MEKGKPEELKTLAGKNFGAWKSAGLPGAPAAPTLSPSASPLPATANAGLEIVVIAGPADVIVPQLQGHGVVRVFDAEGRAKSLGAG